MSVNPTVSYSIFDSVTDDKPKQHTKSWSEARDQLFGEVKLREDKTAVPLFCPAVFNEGASRGAANVTSVFFAVADIDSRKENEPENSKRRDTSEAEVLAFVQRFKPFEHVIYTSHSHKPPNKCAVRFVFPLAVPFDTAKNPSKWKRAWEKFKVWVETGTEARMDPVPCHAAAIYYLPSSAPERSGKAFIHHNEGQLLVLSEMVSPEVATKSLGPDVEVLRRRMYNYAGDAEITHAFRKMMKGEPFGLEGERDNLLTKMCGTLARWTPGKDPEAVAQLFVPSLEAMAQTQIDPPRLSHVVEKLARFATRDVESKAAEAGPSAERAILTLTQGERSTPYSREEILPYVEEQGARDVDDFLASRLVVQYGNGYFIWDRDHYVLQPQASAWACARERLVVMPVNLYKTTANGGVTEMDLPTMVGRYGSVANDTIVDLSLDRSHFDVSTRTFYETVPRRRIVPEYNADIHRWMQLLGGDALLDWVAGVTKLEYLCAALIIKGSKGAGKSLLARSLAMIWNKTGTWADLEAILYENFNEQLFKCPLVVADESLPKGRRNLSSKLRTLISTKSRSLTRKYLPPTQLVGAVRLLITTNNEGVLKFDEDDQTSEDIEAIGSRFVYVEARPETEEFLARFPRSEWVEGGAISRHALWLRDNRPLNTTGRFLVTGHTAAVHRKIVTNNPITSSVCEWIARYLDKPEEIERSHSSYVEREGGNLWINAAAIAETWTTALKNERPITTTTIGRALRTLSLEKAERKVGTRRTLMYRVNLDYVYEWMSTVGIGDRELTAANLQVAGRSIDSQDVVKEVIKNHVEVVESKPVVALSREEDEESMSIP